MARKSTITNPDTDYPNTENKVCLDSVCRALAGTGVACAIFGLALIVTDGSVGIGPAAGGVAMFAGLMCVLVARTVRELGPSSPKEVLANHYQET